MLKRFCPKNFRAIDCFIFLCFAILLFLSGCLDVQKLSIEDRLTCLDFTSKSYAFVPECDSDGMCFEKVHSTFFNFSLENFSTRVQQEIYFYENDLASSWLYYNRALKNIEFIHEACDSGNGLQDISRELNEFSHNLDLAFRKADDASKKSVSILLLESSSLNESDVNLLKEEPLFNDFALIQSNLLQFSSKNFSGNSYASFLSGEREKFNQLSMQYGFKPVILQEFSFFDAIDYYDEKLLLQLPEYKSKFYIPLFADAISSIISYFNNAFEIGNAVNALRHFPSFEFMQSYNGLAGFDDSVPQKFSKLFESDSLHRKELFERSSSVEGKIKSMIPLIAAKADSMNSFLQPIDSNSLNEIFLETSESNGIVSENFSMQNLFDFKENADAKLFELNSRFVELERLAFLQKISFGKSVSGLKQIFSELTELNQSIDFLSSDSIGGINSLCNSRISKTQLQLRNLPVESNSLLEKSIALLDLKNRAVFRASQFFEALPEKKLYYCGQAITSFREFQNALSDFLEYSVNARLETGQCFDFLEKAFSSSQLRSFGELDWSFLAERFKLLKEKNLSGNASIPSIKSDCLKLKQDIELAAWQNPKITDIEARFSNSKSRIGKLNQLSKLFPNTVSKTSMQQLSESFSGFEKFFENGKFNIVYSDLLLDISSSFQEFEFELAESFNAALLEYFEKNASIEFFSDSIPEAGKPFDSRTRIVFSNPFDEIGGPQTVSIPFNGMVSKNGFFSENVFGIKKSGDSIEVNLKNIPSGLTIVEFFSQSTVNALERPLIASISPSTAFFEKNIEFDSKSVIPKLFVQIQLIDSNFLNVENVVAFFGGKRVLFEKKSNSIELFLENVDSSKILSIFFSIKNPIELSFFQNSFVKKSDLLEEFEFSINAANRLPIEFDGSKLAIPLGIESGIEESELFDESFFPIKHSFAGGVLQISGQNFQPLESKKFLLKLELNDSEFVKENLAKSLKTELESIALSASSDKIKSEANSLILELEKLNLFEGLSLERLFSMKSQSNALAVQSRQFGELALNYSILKSELSADLNSFDSSIAFFEEFGFSDSNALQKTLNAAKKAIQSAEKFFAANQPDEAMQNLFEAKNLLSSNGMQSSNGLFEKILIEKNAIASNVENLLAEMKKIGSKKSLAAEQQFYLANSELEQAVASKDLIKAKIAWNRFSAKAKEIAGLHFAIGSDSAKSAFEKISKFEKTVEAVFKKLAELNFLFQEIDESDLVKAKYLPPVSKNQIARMQLQANSLKPPSLAEKLEKFNELVSKKQFFEALDIFSGFSNQLAEKSSEAISLQEKLETSLDSIKENALVSFNSAVSLFNAAKFDQSASDELSKAKTFLGEKSFLKSIVSSNNATSFLSTGKQREKIELPFVFYPIIIAILLVLFVRFKKKKDSEIKKARVQKILRKW